VVRDLDATYHALAAAVHSVQFRGWCAVEVQPLTHLAHQFVSVDVARLDEQALEAMEAQIGVSDFSQSAGQTVVVGMDVGDDEMADIWQLNVEGAQMAFQSLQGVGCVPATI